MKVFGWKKSTAQVKAWDMMKHEAFIDEAARIQNLKADDTPIDKEDKLNSNKILIDEAFRNRDIDNYLRLCHLDNQMQGHNKAVEVDADRKNAETTLIGELVKQIRQKNRGDFIDIPSANTQIVEKA
jgi:hypothetical protein